MKKYTCLLLFLPLLLSACDESSYEESYNEDYNTGYEESYNEDYNTGYEEGYAEGYNEGYEEGYNLGRDDERIDPSNVLSEEEFDEYVQEYIEENY